MTSITSETIQAVEEYQHMIYGIALSRLGNRFDADDVFQEVFLIYFSKNISFRDEGHRKAWLIKTTLNCCKRVLHSTWRRKTTALEDSHELTYQFASREENLVFTALRGLPEKYRTALHLFYFEDFSGDEIARILGISGAAVRMRLKRGRDLMREKLKGEYDFE
ncbi:MAG: sigma-70 family RNA polymerase sigma factor [Oscillospiraceae bacterium]|jgi:RNA polymerase sigma-70 factor (ECF subfamily)|nr:sigma-70 family RNA polymerase sigma factor [Oscillospiraceae bacterium]